MNIKIKVILGAIVGGILGYSYYYFFGCQNGCPLSSNWLIMTGYGVASGLLLTYPSKKTNKQ